MILGIAIGVVLATAFWFGLLVWAFRDFRIM